MADLMNELETETDPEGLATEGELMDVHERAMTRFNRVQSAMRDERRQCLQDRRFYSVAGAQWEGPLEQQWDNKPRIEVNKIHLSVIRIFNEYRANRVSVNFIPRDGSEQPQLIDACAGLFRADEQDSTAEEAYDNAFEEGVGGGFGAWRVRADYDDPESDDDAQRVKLEPIVDADSSVFFDLDAKRYDKSDANYCFVLSAKDRQDYEDEYGDVCASWPKGIYEFQNDWLTPDVVYIAEYYEKETVKVSWTWYKGLPGTSDIKLKTDDIDTATRKSMAASGYKKDREKKITTTKVHKYLMTASQVIEDIGYIVGKNIPVVPYYGKRWFIDNVERCMGHVRLAKDAQRLKNMQLSKLAEISALSTREKPIFTPEQIAGHAQMWSDDNIKDYPYLLVNASLDATGATVAIGPAAYTKTPEIPAPMAALLQSVEQDMQDLLGNQQAAEQVNPAVSGVAIELIQAKLDMQTYIYISNMEKSMARCGQIWLSMAKEIYIEPKRKLKSVNAEGKVGSVVLNQPIVDEASGMPKENGNDLTEANFDCVAKAGPTSASKRAYIVKSMLGMLQFVQDPQTVAIITSIALMYTEGEGMENLREFFRKKLLAMGVIPPTPEEAQELQRAAQNQPPDPQAQYLQASAQEATATAIQKHAATGKTLAETDKIKVETIALAHGIHHDKIASTVNTITGLAGVHNKLHPLPTGDSQ